MVAPDSKQLLTELLSPLLADFHYWFEKSVRLLEDNRIEFLTPDRQATLLQKVKDARAELQSAEQLYKLSDNRVGIDPKLIVKWHRLLMECGSVGRQFRQRQAAGSEHSSFPRNNSSAEPN